MTWFDKFALITFFALPLVLFTLVIGHAIHVIIKGGRIARNAIVTPRYDV